MKKALLYARVSTEEQVMQGASIEAQIERMKSYCAAANLTPALIMDEEAVSGSVSLFNRKKGSLIPGLTARREIKHIIAIKLDRLFRNALDCLETVQKWDKQDVVLHLIDMGGASLHTRSAMGKFFIGMAASFAELERNLISERTTLAINFKKANGFVYGPVPYGFKEVVDPVKGRCLCVQEEDIAIVRLIFALRKRWYSYGSIASHLTNANIPTPAANRGKRKPCTTWCKSTIKHILDNGIYQSLKEEIE